MDARWSCKLYLAQGSSFFSCLENCYTTRLGERARIHAYCVRAACSVTGRLLVRRLAMSAQDRSDGSCICQLRGLPLYAQRCHTSGQATWLTGSLRRVQAVQEACHGLTGIAARDQILMCEGIPLDGAKPLSAYSLPVRVLCCCHGCCAHCARPGASHDHGSMPMPAASCSWILRLNLMLCMMLLLQPVATPPDNRNSQQLSALCPAWLHCTASSAVPGPATHSWNWFRVTAARPGTCTCTANPT